MSRERAPDAKSGHRDAVDDVTDRNASATGDWVRLLPTGDRALIGSGDGVEGLADRYGSPEVTRFGDGTALESFNLQDRVVNLLRGGADGRTVLAAWRLWRGDLCATFGSPVVVTATGVGTDWFVPILGSSAGAVAGALAAATLDAGTKLNAAMNRACAGRCQSPCECQMIPLLPSAPSIVFGTKTLAGVPVGVSVTVTLTLSALLVCA